MRLLPAGFIPLDLMCLLFPAPDVILYADRTNPSPWSLSVKESPQIVFWIGDPLYQFTKSGQSKYNYQGSNRS